MRIHCGGLVVEEDEVGVTAWTVSGTVCVLFPLSCLPYILSKAVDLISHPRGMPTTVSVRTYTLRPRLLCSSPPVPAPTESFSLAQSPSFIPALRAHFAALRAAVSFVKQEACIANCEVKERVSALVSHSRTSKRLTLDEMKRNANPGVPIGNLVLYIRPGKKGLRKQKNKKGKGALVKVSPSLSCCTLIFMSWFRYLEKELPKPFHLCSLPRTRPRRLSNGIHRHLVSYQIGSNHHPRYSAGRTPRSLVAHRFYRSCVLDRWSSYLNHARSVFWSVPPGRRNRMLRGSKRFARLLLRKQRRWRQI